MLVLMVCRCYSRHRAIQRSREYKRQHTPERPRDPRTYIAPLTDKGNIIPNKDSSHDGKSSRPVNSTRTSHDSAIAPKTPDRKPLTHTQSLHSIPTVTDRSNDKIKVVDKGRLSVTFRATDTPSNVNVNTFMCI
jgi:hypothetical protein